MMRDQKLEETLVDLRLGLFGIDPQHDTPIGLIHPYWARKPLNLIDAIIQSLSQEGEIVFDPFVGSGTVAYSAISNNRRAFASDLNPLAVYLTKTVLGLGSFDDEELQGISSFFASLEEKYSQWFLYENNQIIERIRYSVEGDYREGLFSLVPTEIVLKGKNGKDWKGRTVKKVSNSFSFSVEETLLNSPINFSGIELEENSRIAIPRGALVAHFFDAPNMATINCIYAEIKKVDVSDKVREALTFILSSSLPLLRLSDKKASSQWPYWRPKSSLTSRNPLFAIRRRVGAFIKAARWVQKQAHDGIHSSVDSLYESDDQGYCVFECAVQDAISSGIKPDSVHLIVTDPPYADHAPYLEYSELWNRLILERSGKEHFGKEIVKTDAPSRNDDAKSYVDRLCEGLKVCCQSLKLGGFLVFFYQDKTFAHWAAIGKTLAENNVNVVDVLALPKQRRSMKTVTSPGRTLDGDLLIIARKTSSADDVDIKKINSEFSYRRPKQDDRAELFLKYAELIRGGLIHGNINEIAEENEDIYAML